MTNRNLDGIYFRVKRGNRLESVCFSDLTDEEMDKVLEGHSVEWLKNTCKILAEPLSVSVMSKTLSAGKRRKRKTKC